MEKVVVYALVSKRDNSVEEFFRSKKAAEKALVKDNKHFRVAKFVETGKVIDAGGRVDV